MHHVYYHQRYLFPQLGIHLRLLHTAVSLHYAPDGTLRRVNLAQVSDVPPLPRVVVTSPEQALAAAQLGLASWPGFAAGSPAAWPPGTVATLLGHADLVLSAPRGPGSYRLLWRMPVLDARLESFVAQVDAADGTLVAVMRANPSDGDTTDCTPPGDPPSQYPDPVAIPAKARAENDPPLGVRDVYASPCGYENEDTCGGSCTHEAIRTPPALETGIPRIEVYHGMPSDARHLHCGDPSEGNYMRVGLKLVSGFPTYDEYGAPPSRGGKEWTPHQFYRRFAGDAMYYTLQTMEVFRDQFDRCGFDGACSTARVVVDALGGPNDAARFEDGPTHTYAPVYGVQINHPSDTWRSMSASLDVISHEWGHGVDTTSPGDFVSRCPGPGHTEICEMMEGFGEVVGHIVERLKQLTQDPDLNDDTFFVENWDWAAQEDSTPPSGWPDLRRADRYSSNTCPPGPHHSVHAEDVGCGGGPYSPNGNRLAVVLKLMTDGGHNPAYGQMSPCTGCDINVAPLGFDMAARILFRVLDTEADAGTVDWDELPYLARGAVRDLFSDEECPAIQTTVFDAFAAVGYPQDSPRPCVMCGPIQACPPCCPPPCCDDSEE
jgi:hypothetical protein